jgi:hypothetical protein
MLCIRVDDEPTTTPAGDDEPTVERRSDIIALLDAIYADMSPDTERADDEPYSGAPPTPRLVRLG